MKRSASNSSEGDCRVASPGEAPRKDDRARGRIVMIQAILYNRAKGGIPMTINFILLVLVAAAIALIIILDMSLRRNTARIEELRRDQKDNSALTLMQQQIGQLTGWVRRPL